MSYYVPKRNRCFGCPAVGNGTLCFGTLTSISTATLAASTVYTVTQSQNNPAVEAKKGRGNRQKRGSGGSSFAAYMARKVGNIKCDCNSKCINT